MSLKADIETLVGALRGPCPAIRILAAESLGEIGNRLTVDPLLELLGDGEADLRAAAGEAIRKIKLALLPPGSRESDQ